MRIAFLEALTELAYRDKDLYLINADTGFKVFDEFRNIFPKQYLNIGISESAMISIASGLALSNKNVFIYGIVPFITMRCFEQIRNDLCFHKLPVKLIGVGGGLTYGAEGASHHSIEDIAVMSSLPNMSVVCPGDPVETKLAMENLDKVKGPIYIRLGKTGENTIHKNGVKQFQIGKGIVIKDGHSLAIVATGNMLETALDVHSRLTKIGMMPKLISMHTVKPIDRELLIDIVSDCNTIVTIEEHSIIGGLGSRVSDIITEENIHVRLKKITLPDKYVETVGDHNYLRKVFNLLPDQITQSIQNTLLVNSKT